ncbi:MAG: NAD(P)-dependent oxidoreductase [Gammaproteobacteria bacterium]
MKVAILGTGLMGRPMAERLLDTAHTVWVYNRTRAKAKSLAALGANVVEQPVDAIRAAEVIVTMLSDAGAFRETILSDEAKEQLARRTVIQMGTIGPHESLAFSKEILGVKGDYMEAPVLGSTPEAMNGKLIIMVGASPVQFDHWRALLQCFGPNPVRVGEVPDAATVKLALNQLIAAEMAGFALSLGFVRRNHVNVDVFMEILRSSHLYAAMFDRKLPRLLKRHYADPNFPTEHVTKDMGLFLDQAKSLGLSTQVLEGIKELLDKTQDMGLTGTDYAAIYEAVDPEK